MWGEESDGIERKYNWGLVIDTCTDLLHNDVACFNKTEWGIDVLVTPKNFQKFFKKFSKNNSSVLIPRFWVGGVCNGQLKHHGTA